MDEIQIRKVANGYIVHTVPTGRRYMEGTMVPTDNTYVFPSLLKLTNWMEKEGFGEFAK